MSKQFEDTDIVGWFTKGGKHIPIRLGDSGTYKLYRVGKVDFGKKNYRISFATDPSYADTYTITDAHDGMEVEEYDVEIKNPLVIDVKADKVKAGGYYNDEQAGTYAAYNKLFGTDYDYKKDPGVYDHGRFYDYAKYGSPKARRMLQQRDQEIMEEAVKQGYDAVIYKFDRPETMRPDGIARKEPMSKNEVLLPGQFKDRVKKRGKK